MKREPDSSSDIPKSPTRPKDFIPSAPPRDGAIVALESIVIALLPFDTDDRERIIKSVCAFFGINQ